MLEKLNQLVEEGRLIRPLEYTKLEFWKDKVEDIILGLPLDNKDYWLSKFNEIKYKSEDHDFPREENADFWAFQKGTTKAISLLSRLKERLSRDLPITKNKKVFVVHGRNLKIRNSMFEFLMAIGLEPIEWEEAISFTGKGSPYIGEILDEAFSNAQVIVVLFTPDDVAKLKEEFRKETDPTYEKELTGQARLNVIFEAGMAFGRNSDQTILVQIGKLRTFSDIYGRHYIELSNNEKDRKKLIDRLKTAKLDIKIKDENWLTIGDFSIETDNDIKLLSTIKTNIREIHQECFNALNEIINYGFKHISVDSIPVNERSEIIFQLDKLKSNRKIIRDIEILYNERNIGQQEGNYIIYLYIGIKFEIILTLHDFKIQKIRMSLEEKNLSTKSIEKDKQDVQALLKDFANNKSLEYNL